MKNGKVQMTGIRAVATANGNGNGNGHKKAEVKETAKPVEVAEENRVQIVPKFDQLTTKGKEMFADMGNLENAKLFLDDLMMEVGCEHTTIAGLMMLLDAIRVKAEDPWKTDHPVDFINYLQDHLFHWTVEASACTSHYIEAVKSGNFVVDKLIETDSAEDPAEKITPPKRELKSVPAGRDILSETHLDEPAADQKKAA